MKLTAVLKYSEGNNTKSFPLTLGQVLTLGRSRSAQIQINDENLSGVHCTLRLHKDRIKLTDLDSKNGTYLNKIRIDSSEFFIGDEVRIGKTKITLDLEAMDDFSRVLLAFPGNPKDRVSHELDVDYTGAKIPHHQRIEPKDIEKELSIRKSANSQIKLSKTQIKMQYKKSANLAITLDCLLFLVILFAPVYLMSSDETFIPENYKSILMALIQSTIMGVFCVVNFKILKFSLGEKIAGIEKKYHKQ